MIDETYYATLKAFFKKQGITQQQIGDALGTSQSYVNSLLTGRNPIGKSTAAKLHEAYGLSAAWLLTGEGELLSANVAATPEVPTAPAASLNPDETIAKLVDIAAGQQKQISQLIQIINAKL